MTISLSNDFLNDFRQSIAAEIRTDLVTRLLYSTDASMYQVEPLGVVFPRSVEELSAITSLAARHQVPLLARGSGSSLAGQAVGQALILDTTRYLTRILDLNPEERTATVEPGVILTDLNRAAQRYGLTYGPDPASAERATMGGVVANNATGAHSIIYGMAADHLLTAETIFGDGSLALLESVPLAEAARRADSANGSSPEASLYRIALEIRDGHAETIRQKWPRVWRRASGYSLNYLLPWSPSAPPQWWGSDHDPALGYPPTPPGELNLAPLLAGSEGTLGILSRLTVRLVPISRRTILGVLAFPSIAEACEATPALLELQPSAVELIPGDLIELARSVPAYASQAAIFSRGSSAIPAACLVVEFSGDEPGQLLAQAAKLGPDALIAEDPSLQKQIWEVRKVGLGILSSRPGDEKSLAFIEDIAVPVENLGHFVRELENIFNAHGVRANFYAHASAGCLHIRPLGNIKAASGIAVMSSIAVQAVDLALSLGGVPSGEHGDGLARSQWMERTFGPEVLDLFYQVKAAADPHGLLNPGKIIDAPPMENDLRYDTGYRAQPWQPVMSFANTGGLAPAIEMCNGAGVCRKSDGVMCPSFQVSKEEMHSTRGRSNLLRALISGKFPTQQLGEETVREALDLCLACKGCKSECPSGVDVARLKYEFTNEYYKTHTRKLRDYVFGYIGSLAPLGAPFAPLANAFLGSGFGRAFSERFLHLAPERKFPAFARASHVPRAPRLIEAPDVLFLTDTFSRYFHPETEIAGRKALEAAGLRVQVIPVIGAGRTLISKGFLEPAKRHAERLLAAIRLIDPQGKLPVVGVEPSEIYTLKDEFLDFFPEDPYAGGLARRSWMIDEFLIRPDAQGSTPLSRSLNGGAQPGKKVLLHGHCYQKARPPADDGLPVGVQATVAMLASAGYQVEVIDSGCCGMAGAFGYEKEHYEFSMAVGEQRLFPAVRAAGPEDVVAAVGTSCRSQIEDGVKRETLHPILLIAG